MSLAEVGEPCLVERVARSGRHVAVHLRKYLCFIVTHYLGETVWHLADPVGDWDDDWYYHATAQCPRIDDGRHTTSVTFFTYGQLTYDPCEFCCPPTLVIPRQVAFRIPAYYHVDKACPEIPARYRELNDFGAPSKIEFHPWPSRDHNEMVTNVDTWRPCSTCIPSREILLPRAT